MTLFVSIDVNLAVNSCADDARSVGALKVSSHDLVELSVTQTLKYVDKYMNKYVELDKYGDKYTDKYEEKIVKSKKFRNVLELNA